MSGYICYSLFKQFISLLRKRGSKMNYEVVTMPEKKVVGVRARTKNSAPNMSEIIGGLWNHFYQDGIYSQIPSKVNDKGLGIYSDYETDFNGEYEIFVGCEVEQEPTTQIEDTSVKIIPASNYAKFVVRGNMHQAVANFWSELWEMNLDRSYLCDFEEYQNNSIEDAEVHIYISIK